MPPPPVPPRKPAGFAIAPRDSDRPPRTDRTQSRPQPANLWLIGVLVIAIATPLLVVGGACVWLFTSGGRIGVGAPAAQTGTESATRPLPPAAQNWHDSDAGPAPLGMYQVAVTEAAWRQLGIKDRFRKDVASEIPAFVVSVKVSNPTEDRMLHYETWAARWLETSSGGFATLEDDLGNTYKAQQRASTFTIEGETDKVSIRPGASIADTLVFERPLKRTKHLTLTLPGRRQGLIGTLRIRIPASAIRWEAPEKD